MALNGRVNASLHRLRRQPDDEDQLNGDTAPVASPLPPWPPRQRPDLDPELAAELALQNAPPVRPGT
jgi:hypothetical protein